MAKDVLSLLVQSEPKETCIEDLIIGREEYMDQIREVIKTNTNRFIHVYGDPSVGKTYIANNVLSSLNFQIFHIDILNTDNTVKFFENVNKIVQIHDNNRSCFFVHGVEHTMKTTMLTRFLNLIKKKTKYIKVFLFCKWSKTYDRNYITNIKVSYPTLRDYLTYNDNSYHFHPDTVETIVNMCNYRPFHVLLAMRFTKQLDKITIFDETDVFYDNNEKIYFTYDTFHSNLKWIKDIESCSTILDMISQGFEIDASARYKYRDYDLKRVSYHIAGYVYRTYYRKEYEKILEKNKKKRNKITQNILNNLHKEKNNTIKKLVVYDDCMRFRVPFLEQELIKNIMNPQKNETSKE
jgi:hypothetical protein